MNGLELLLDAYSNKNIIWLWFFAFARFIGVMNIMPVFTSTLATKLLKANFSIMLAVLVYPLYKDIHIDNNTILLNVVLIISNFAYGLLIGYFLSFPIWLIESCGNIIDMQRGEQMGNIINHLTNNPASSIASLLVKAFIAYFVVNNGLLFTFDLLFKSFNIIPVNNLLPILDSQHITLYINIFASYFYWVVVLVVPIIMALLLIDLILGLVSAFIPQMNVTILSMPIKSALALALLSIYIGYLFHEIFAKFITQIQNIL
jgi:type III secretion protein T